ncbi:unnamed protein product, partial [Mesorhabditis spiculigera]
MLMLQKTRIVNLLKYYPEFKSKILSPLLSKINALLIAAENWRGIDGDLWAPANSTILPWGGLGNNMTLPPLNGTKNWQNSTRNNLRKILENALGTNFTDAQWQNISGLLNGGFRKGGNQTTTQKQLEKLVSGGKIGDLKRIFGGGDIMQNLKEALGVQAQANGNQMGGLVEQALEAFKKLQNGTVGQATAATTNTQNIASGAMNSLFGGMQQWLSQLQG